MLSIGIDVSKGKSTVCGMKPGGEIVYTPFEIQHTREGMSELVSLLRSSGEEVRAVLESTGSYHCPVVAALLENGIFVSVVNSLRMKRFCSQSIRKVKTDRIDAMQIALYGLAYWQELQPTKLPEDTYLSNKWGAVQIVTAPFSLLNTAYMSSELFAIAAIRFFTPRTGCRSAHPSAVPRSSGLPPRRPAPPCSRRGQAYDQQNAPPAPPAPPR